MAHFWFFILSLHRILYSKYFNTHIRQTSILSVKLWISDIPDISEVIDFITVVSELLIEETWGEWLLRYGDGGEVR